MKSVWLTVAAFCIVVSGVAAQAETVRLPQSGNPAFSAALPDGWTHEVLSDGSLRAFSPAHTAAITLAIVRFSGALEELAASALQSPDGMPPQNTGPVELSGYGGAAFDGTTVNAEGVKAKIHLLLVRLDDRHLAAATLMTADNLDAAQGEAAAAVLKAVTLSKVAPPTEPAPAPPPAPETPPAPPPPATP
ncbi:MAG TPA: hypothetical protein VGC36_16465 [Rhizomicrobium sp.]